MRWLRVPTVVVIAVSAIVTGGCGFIATGGNSSTKPSGFVLHGYVSVVGAMDGAAGAACQAPPTVPDIASGGPVRVVVGPDGAAIAEGTLGAGILRPNPSAPAAARCDFPFEIGNVPGEQEQYSIVVGIRPAATFTGTDLRADKPAVIEVRAGQPG